MAWTRCALPLQLCLMAYSASAALIGGCGKPSVLPPPQGSTGEPVVAAQNNRHDPAPLQPATRVSEPTAQPAPRSPTDNVLALSGTRSRSLGGPDNGTLQGGVALPVDGPGFVGNPRRSAEARFGTVELVQALARAAAASYPGAPAKRLVVNDISLEQGGPIPHHGSHQSGRDVDLLFFLQDMAGNPHPPLGVPLEPDGTGVDFRDLSRPDDDVPVRIDLPRTWRFIAALIEAARGDLQRIFIVEHLRTLLLAEAKRQQAPEALRRRFAQVACQPGTPHDDHMHVRFFCSLEDLGLGCQDKPPLYPERLAQLEAAGLDPQLAPPPNRARRAASRARTVSPGQARDRAGPMHADVVAFLDRRKGWLKKQTPPRRYCK